MSRPGVCVLSIDAGGTFLKAALVKSDGTFAEDSFLRVPVDSDAHAGHIQTAYTQLAALGLAKARENELELSAVSICIPGPFDYVRGMSLMTHKYVSVKGIPMRPWIWEGTGNIPVYFLHDSHAFLLGALWNTDLSEYARVAGVIIGTGLGFATLIDGNIYTNEQGGPGISIFARPYRDSTSEEYVSRRGIISRYRALAGGGPEQTDVADIAVLARQGQPEAVFVFHETGRYLAEIVHDILSDNRIECLLLGGAISKSADLYMPELKMGLSDLSALRHIAPAKDIDMAPVLGAARAAFFPASAAIAR